MPNDAGADGNRHPTPTPLLAALRQSPKPRRCKAHIATPRMSAQTLIAGRLGRRRADSGPLGGLSHESALQCTRIYDTIRFITASPSPSVSVSTLSRRVRVQNQSISITRPGFFARRAMQSIMHQLAHSLRLPSLQGSHSRHGRSISSPSTEARATAAYL